MTVLAAGHEEIADAFVPDGHRAAVSDMLELVDDLPVLIDAVAWLTCRHEYTYVHGDHAIVIGAVMRAHHTRRQPLIRHASRYRQIA